MTTIAYDGYVLAADTKYTCGDFVSGYQNKITMLNDGSVFAMSGSIEYVNILKEYFNGGEKPVLPENADFCAIHIVQGVATEYHGNLNGYPAMKPCAAGSGEKLALAAMKCGKGAIDAVKIACEIDIYSGGEVTHVVINER